MSTLKIDVRSLSDSLADAAQSMETGKAQPPRYSFSSAQALMRTLGGKRLRRRETVSGCLGFSSLHRHGSVSQAV